MKTNVAELKPSKLNSSALQIPRAVSKLNSSAKEQSTIDLSLHMSNCGANGHLFHHLKEHEDDEIRAVGSNNEQHPCRIKIEEIPSFRDFSAEAPNARESSIGEGKSTVRLSAA